MHLGTKLRDMRKTYSEWQELQGRIPDTFPLCSSSSSLSPSDAGTGFIRERDQPSLSLDMEASQYTVDTTKITTEKGKFIF